MSELKLSKQGQKLIKLYEQMAESGRSDADFSGIINMLRDKS